MRVTQIVRLKGGRFRIGMDNGLTFPLYQQEMEEYHLEEDAEVPETVWAEICERILGKRARKRALYLLQKQDRTRQEILSRLIRDGYPEELAEEAVRSMEEYGYINDSRYAEVFIRYRQESMSKREILRRLMEKGIERDVAEEQMEAVCETDEEAIADALLKKRHYDPETADQKERQRVTAWLARKGFSYELIRRLTENKKQYTIE